jgi:hypothetical protein
VILVTGRRRVLPSKTPPAELEPIRDAIFAKPDAR